MNHLQWRKRTGFVTVLQLLCLTAQADVAREFEEKYQKWRDWQEQHPFSSDPTWCQEYKDISGMGLPVLPLIMEKMSAKFDNLHLEDAVHVITKKYFVSNEWPLGGGGSISAAKMYIEWWETERFHTPQQFEERLRQWQVAKKSGDANAVDEAYRAILYLGLPVLPHVSLGRKKAQTQFGIL